MNGMMAKMGAGHGDQKLDCQPKVYRFDAKQGTVRDADGECVNGTEYCSSYCQNVFKYLKAKVCITGRIM